MIVMEKKQALFVPPCASSANVEGSGSAGRFFLPSPEEGHRLIGAFLRITRPSLREAIIELVTELSAPGEDAE